MENKKRKRFNPLALVCSSRDYEGSKAAHRWALEQNHKAVSMMAFNQKKLPYTMVFGKKVLIKEHELPRYIDAKMNITWE